MWRCEWIWQTYCSVTMTSFASGLVTTIFCSSGGCCSSPLSLLQADREKETSATITARPGETFIAFFPLWLPCR